MTLLERLGGREEIIRGVTEEFRRLSRHPHPSHQEGATAADLTERLEQLGLTVQRDGAGNLLAELPATPGREAVPRIILQGHMDMVCAVAPGSGYVPETDPVRVVVRDGFLRSDGRSSLGADNMLGNAAVLWLLATGQVAHGPVRLLFTTAEEVGMGGAKEVDPAWLAGAKWLLNTDGFHVGRAIVGSAGGRRELYCRPLNRVAVPEGGAWTLSLTGGTGGHSGYDIHRGRANGVKLLGDLLGRLGPDCAIARWEAGTSHNAIPAQGTAVVVVPPEGEERLRRAAAEAARRWKETYGATDPHLTLTLSPAPRPEQVWAPPVQRDALGLVEDLFSGVRAMHPDFPNVVGASANLGFVREEQGELQVGAFLRSCSRAAEEALAAGRAQCSRARGFALTLSCYGPWPGRADAPLPRLLSRVSREQLGQELEISAVHVGLEPSIFREKAPGLELISTGPEILDAHSVDERAPLAALPDFVLLLAGALEGLPAEP